MNNWCVGFSRIFLLGILIFKGLTARHLYKSFGVKGLKFGRFSGKVKGLPVICHAGTSALEENRLSVPRPGQFSLGKSYDIHYRLSWVGPRTGLDGCGEEKPFFFN
jgi:hypothetical protein